MRIGSIVRCAAAGAALLFSAGTGFAQHAHGEPARLDSAAMGGMKGMAGMEMHGMGAMDGPLGIPLSRTGSGTSWVPDASPMHAKHFMAAGWEMMLHGVAFGYYDRQNGRRGEDQAGSVNWAMLMAARPLAGGRLQLHGMMSAEPFTVADGGYPLLLQTGETYRGAPLHDRQHPHDLFMELSAGYQRAVARNLGVELYVAPVGEPAIGPVAFPHRPSATNDPFAPLGHHWQDATHITFGVATAGVFSRTWKLEGSVFNGREPDAERTDFDFRRLDSYSARATVNPSAAWSLSASVAYLASPEELHPDDSERRFAVSAMHGRRFGRAGQWSSAVGFGGNEHAHGGLEPSFLAESNLDLDARNSVFGRAEYVRKSGEDLVLAGVPDDAEFSVGALSLGYVREVASLGWMSAGVGVRGAVNFVPAALESAYGSRTPTGWSVYVRLRPKAMEMTSAPGASPRPVLARPVPLPAQPDTLAHPPEHHHAPGMTMPAAPDSMPGMRMPADSMPGMKMPPLDTTKTPAEYHHPSANATAGAADAHPAGLHAIMSGDAHPLASAGLLPNATSGGTVSGRADR
jgi:hypothetical protein